MGSLQDALLKSGLADEEKLKKARKRKPPPKSSARKHAGSKSRPQHSGKKSSDMGSRKAADARSTQSSSKPKPQKSDLERAWIARQKAEKAEKERVKQARVADQEARRQRNLKLDKIVEGRALNKDDAEIPRYFEHLGRIRRVLCTQQQRDALNQGKLGLVNLRGRYLIVEPEVLAEYQALAEDLVPDLTGAEPQDQSESDDYPPVPDEITW